MNSNSIFELISTGGLFDKAAIAEDIKLFKPKDIHAPSQNLATQVDNSIPIIAYDRITEEEEQEWRKVQKIRLTNWGSCGPVCKTFSEIEERFGWSEVVLENILAQGWKVPSHVQQVSFPCIDSDRDIICLAPTGSGKTAAYLVPLIGAISKYSTNEIKKCTEKPGAPVAIVIAPTRELCEQISRVALSLGHGIVNSIFLQADKNTIKSLTDDNKNDSEIEKKPLILVSTPMLLINIIKENVVSLDNLKWFIMDEADLLMEDQFIEQTDKLLELLMLQNNDNNTKNSKKDEQENDSDDSSDSNDSSDSSDDSESDGSNSDDNENNSSNSTDKLQDDENETSYSNEEDNNAKKEEKSVPRIIQKCLYSASFSDKIYDLSSSFLRDPIFARVGLAGLPSENVDQRFVFAGAEKFKMFTLKQQLNEFGKPPILVFVQNTERAEQVAKALAADTVIPCAPLHSGLTHEKRIETVTKFRKGEIWLLVCTDIAARGLDFTGVSLVINFDLPASGVTYLHRVGRTGRQKKGVAISLYTERDANLLQPIANAAKSSGCNVPENLTNFKVVSKNTRKKMVSNPLKRSDIVSLTKNQKKSIQKKEGNRKWSIENNKPFKPKRK